MPAAAAVPPEIRRSPSKRILIVDDDNDLRANIASYLANYGFDIEEARNATELDQIMGQGPVDLIILDLMLPGEDGLSICRRLVRGDAPPIIMLSAMGEEVDRVIGLEIGADDYLPKPCNPRELLARARAVLRRRDAESPNQPAIAPTTISFDGFQLDLVRRRLQAADGSVIVLSNNEFALLAILLLNSGQVLSREALARMIEIGQPEDVHRAVDMLVSRLRRKLQAQSVSEIIATVRGEGYRLAAEVVDPGVNPHLAAAGAAMTPGQA